MELENKSSNIINQSNGFVMPRSGDGGPHICKECGHNFLHRGNRSLFDVFKSPFVKCPKCGSFKTKRDSGYVYYSNLW